MAIVSILKSADNVREQASEAGKLMRKLLLPFGGADFFFTGSEVPLFLLDLTLPADNESGVNFDIRLAYAAADLARDLGAKKIVFAVKTADGFFFDDVLEKSGYAKLRAVDGVSFVDLRHCEANLHQSDTRLAVDEVRLYEPVAGADIIISLAKFKSGEGHLFGSALNNVDITAALDEDMSYEQRQRALVDVFSVIAPDLTIVDGLIGESGFQPQMEDFVLAAVDAVAADAVLAALADIPPEGLEYLQLAAQYGLGVGEPNDIRIYGDDIGDIM